MRTNIIEILTSYLKGKPLEYYELVRTEDLREKESSIKSRNVFLFEPSQFNIHGTDEVKVICSNVARIVNSGNNITFIVENGDELEVNVIEFFNLCDSPKKE